MAIHHFMKSGITGVATSSFEVPLWMHLLSGFVHRHPKFWRWLARRETASIERQLDQTSLEMPIYISGLARSGSTLLHEVVASHPAVATHRVKDYPLVFTPYWWRRATAKIAPSAPRERVHRDGVVVTSASPDALEEMLWMAFFPHCHDPEKSNLPMGGDAPAEFDAFYKAHLRKLLLAEGKTRYAAKANYHVARLAYLVRLFADAKFIIPVREPAAHIASLMRQHEWFSQGERTCPRALAYMQRSGHFEFGLDRRPLNLGDHDRVRRIREAWAAGDEVRGLAMYWDMVHAYLARLLESDDQVRSASLIVRFEEVCHAPLQTFARVFDHCRLPDAESICQRWAAEVRKPVYAPNLSEDEMAMIRQETGATARRWGY